MWSLLVKAIVFLNDDLKVMCQHKRNSLSTHSKLDLEVAQEVAEVNMEQLSPLSHHDVVRVPVSYAQHIRSHTVSSTGEGEGLSRLHQSVHTLEGHYY